MIGRIMNAAPVWLLAVLLGITVYAGMQARHYAQALSESELRVARAEDRAEILLEHQRWQRHQLETMTRVLQARDDQVQMDGELIDLVRQAARQLERDDAETADWADQPSPAAVRQWLRDLAAEDDHGAGGGDANRAAVPADASAAPGPRGDAQP